MNNIIDIQAFRNAIISFQRRLFQSERIEQEPIGEIMRFYKGKNRTKIVLSTAHAAIPIKFEELLQKIVPLISNDLSISDTVELFYTKPIPEYDKNRLLELSKENEITLTIYDYSSLFEEKEFKTFFKNSRYEIEGISDVNRVLYDMLSGGKNASEIKNSILYSLIVFTIYNAENKTLSESTLERQIQSIIPNVSINQAISYLKRNQRIVRQANDEFALSPKETANIEAIIKKSTKNEHVFYVKFKEIFDKYNLQLDDSKTNSLIKKLMVTYEVNFKTNIKNPVVAFDDKTNNAFLEFKDILAKETSDKSQIDNIIQDIRQLCENNSFLNKVSASEAFISLYDSNEFVHYLDNKNKHIYLDTPVLVYYLCSLFTPTMSSLSDWDNNLYLSSKHLLQKSKGKRNIKFYTTYQYINETAGELNKALRIASYEKYGILFSNMSDTGNTFYSYFTFLKRNGHISSIDSFAQFCQDIGFQNTNPDDVDFIRVTANRIKTILTSSRITYEKTEPDTIYSEALVEYDNILKRKNKNRTDSAKKSDVNLVIHLSKLPLCDEQGKNLDYYICSWDPTFYPIDKWLNEQDPQKFHMFSSYNPSKLANKLSMEQFKIDSSCITDTVFAYADANYAIHTKVRNLYDNDLSVFSNSSDESISFIDRLEALKNRYLYTGEDEFDNEKRDDNVSIDTILEYFNSKVKDSNTIDEFNLFYKTEEGKKNIYTAFENAFKAQKDGRDFKEDIDKLIVALNDYLQSENDEYQQFL